MIAPIDLTAVAEEHRARVLADRDDPAELHASDLQSCDTALWQRTHDREQLPLDDDSFANFERGHAYETRLFEALEAYADANSFVVHRGQKVEYHGIIGNVDFMLYDGTGKLLAVIDPTTTASNKTDWKYGHALKSAFYAVATGAPMFCEWVTCIGFAGKIVAQEAHWFSLDDEAPPLEDGTVQTWRERVESAITHIKLMADARGPSDDEPGPPFDPVKGELETWRCGKVVNHRDGTQSGFSYCRAKCPKNAAYVMSEIPA